MFFIVDHNFWTRNLSKSSKVSKVLDFSLVSNKSFSKILQSGGLGLGPDELGQKGSTCDITHKKSKIKIIFFFIADSKTCWVFWGF